MHVVIDIASNQIIHNGQPISLDDFRTYLMTNWEPLVAKNLTKAISDQRGNTRFVYDWASIFNVATQSGYIISEFLNNIAQPGPQSAPALPIIQNNSYGTSPDRKCRP